jgi:hypothetical protein
VPLGAERRQRSRKSARRWAGSGSAIARSAASDRSPRRGRRPRDRPTTSPDVRRADVLHSPVHSVAAEERRLLRRDRHASI